MPSLSTLIKKDPKHAPRNPDPKSKKVIDPNGMIYKRLIAWVSKDENAFYRKLRDTWDYDRKDAQDLVIYWSNLAGKTAKKPERFMLPLPSAQKKPIVAPAPKKVVVPAIKPIAAVPAKVPAAAKPKPVIAKRKVMKTIASPKEYARSKKRALREVMTGHAEPPEKKARQYEDCRKELSTLKAKYVKVMREKLWSKHRGGEKIEATAPSDGFVPIEKGTHLDLYDGKKMRWGDKANMVFYVGAGASVESGIPTFAVLAGQKPQDNGFVVNAQKSFWKHYGVPCFAKGEKKGEFAGEEGKAASYERKLLLKEADAKGKGQSKTYKSDDPCRPDQFIDPPRGVNGAKWSIELMTQQQVLSSRTREKNPFVLTDVWKWWVDAMKGKKPTRFHMAMASLDPAMVITTNVDCLELAAGIRRDSLVMKHGTVFVGGGADDVVPIASSKDINYDMYMGVVMYGEEDKITDAIETAINGRLNDGCLVIVGSSDKVLPFWMDEVKPKKVIIVNPNPGDVVRTMERFKEKQIQFEAFRNTKEFVDFYKGPEWDVKPRHFNTDSEVLSEAAKWFREWLQAQ